MSVFLLKASVLINRPKISSYGERAPSFAPVVFCCFPEEEAALGYVTASNIASVCSELDGEQCLAKQL